MAKSYVSKDKDDEIEDLANEFKDALTNKNAFAYSFGHFGNDVTYAVWNLYSGWYLNEVLRMKDEDSGYVSMITQLIDIFG